MEIHSPHISNKKMSDVLDFAQYVDFHKGPKGGMSMFREYNDFIGILYTKALSPHKKKKMTANNFKRIIEEVWEIYKNGGKVAPLLGVAFDIKNGIPNAMFDKNFDGENRYRDVVAVQRAPGEVLVNAPIEERLYGSEKNYEEMAKTFAMILDSAIKQDIHNRNIIHHPAAGFNVIDFNELNEKGSQPIDFRSMQVGKLLKSFIPPLKKNVNVELFRKQVIKEQQILVTNLNKAGIKEAEIALGLKKVDILNSPSIDKLFSMES